jgi:hypothetical protein
MMVSVELLAARLLRFGMVEAAAVVTPAISTDSSIVEKHVVNVRASFCDLML